MERGRAEGVNQTYTLGSSQKLNIPLHFNE
uniref:Uncharacterized protein n=1 Tax=Anguilla anguilla TaxID=7936 RepID=A0A0E9PKK3_ANGAN